MKYKVLKPLKYAHDGVTVKSYAEDDDIDVHERFAPGLLAGGHIGEPGKSKVAKGADADKPAA